MWRKSTVNTADRDYEKFPGLRWRHPLTGNAAK